MAFDLCIIGAGSGNFVVDKRLADYQIALVEAGRFGGTCLNAGCIPTKMMVLPADLASANRDAAAVDVELKVEKVDFEAITSRIFTKTDAHSAAALNHRKKLPNVTVFQDLAYFVDPHTLQVGDTRITADRFVLAAGSRPVLPDISGLDDHYLAPLIHTSDSIMRIKSLPKRMIIVGGGYISAEFAHIFSSYGTRVTVVNRSGALLRQEDRDVSERFTDLMSKKVVLRLNQRPISLEAGYRGGICLRTADGFNWEYNYEADVILFATGRRPNSDTLNLEAAGVAVDQDSGVVLVDEHQQTSADHIYALGDISNTYQLKHVANAESRTVLHNLLVDLTGEGEKVATDHRFVPHAVFSNPQVASVGATEHQLEADGTDYVAHTQKYSDVAYGWAMNDDSSFCKVLADPKTGLLLGAHIIGPQAATLIQPLIQAMSFGLDVRSMARGQYWIHPALSEVVENAILGLKLDS